MSLLGAARIPATQQLCQLHAQPSLGQSCTGESLVPMHAGPLQLIQRFATLWTVACQASVSVGFSRQEYCSVLAATGCHVLLKHIFPAARAANPLSTWCCQNPCDPSSTTTSTPGPRRGKPKSSRATSGANPVEDPSAEVEIKPRLKPRGSG